MKPRNVEAVGGTLYKSSQGWCIDTCLTDAEHLAAPIQPGNDRRRCRVLISDLLEAFAGQGVVAVSVDGVGLSVVLEDYGTYLPRRARYADGEAVDG